MIKGDVAKHLAALEDEFRGRLVNYTRAVDHAVARLKAGSIIDTVVGIGDIFPDFILPDSRGRLWRLETALAEGPVVLAFHRGYWCDFCHLNMQTLAEISPNVRAMGCQIVAISPQNASRSAKLAAETGADFPILCDIGLGVATGLGLSYIVGDDLQRELALLQVDLDAENCSYGWLMPITATFVINTDGRIAARHLDPDPRSRMDRDAILQAASNFQSAARI